MHGLGSGGGGEGRGARRRHGVFEQGSCLRSPPTESAKTGLPCSFSLKDLSVMATVAEGFIAATRSLLRKRSAGVPGGVSSGAGSGAIQAEKSDAIAALGPGLDWERLSNGVYWSSVPYTSRPVTRHVVVVDMITPRKVCESDRVGLCVGLDGCGREGKERGSSGVAVRKRLLGWLAPVERRITAAAASNLCCQAKPRQRPAKGSGRSRLESKLSILTGTCIIVRTRSVRQPGCSRVQVYSCHGVPKPPKPAKIMSTGALVNFSIFYTAEFRSQIRPIQDTL